MFFFGVKSSLGVVKKFQCCVLQPLSSRMRGIRNTNMKTDMIGPRNPVSNLRQIIFHIPKNESPVETEFRLHQEEVRQWNEAFWTDHNTEFFQKRRAFSEARKLGSSSPGPMEQITADEMSLFYKKFLDEKWKTHMMYNFQWYHRNILLLVSAFKVAVHRGMGFVLGNKHG